MTELERSLTTLGRALDVPDGHDLVPVVLAGIGPRSAPRPARRKRVLVVAVALVAALAATLAIPDARSALFRVLHIGGERAKLLDEPLGLVLEPVRDAGTVEVPGCAVDRRGRLVHSLQELLE